MFAAKGMYILNIMLSCEASKVVSLQIISVLCFRDKNTTGSSTTPPIRNRTALNVNGPTYSIPTLWATKATPQIKAVIASRKIFWWDRTCLNTLFFLILLCNASFFIITQPHSVTRQRLFCFYYVRIRPISILSFLTGPAVGAQIALWQTDRLN